MVVSVVGISQNALVGWAPRPWPGPVGQPAAASLAWRVHMRVTRLLRSDDTVVVGAVDGRARDIREVSMTGVTSQVHLVETVREALTAPGAAESLRSYYDPAGAYSGCMFLSFDPGAPNQISAADLLAVLTLGNPAPRPAVVRELLTGEEAAELLARIPLDWDVATMTDEEIDIAQGVHDRLRDLTEDRTWLTASKLLARKRPAVYPMRDRVVTVAGRGDRVLVNTEREPNLRGFRHVMSNPEVREQLGRLRVEASELLGEHITDPDLRLLDALLWLY